MSRKPAAILRPNRVLPPDDLPTHLRAIWCREFAAVPAGHFAQCDLGAMLDLVRLVHEVGEAHAAMLAKRNRDTATHWRACVALVQSARRSLRLLPHARQSPRRVGVLVSGNTRADGSAYDPPERGAHDWRSLFANGGEVTSAKAKG